MMLGRLFKLCLKLGLLAAGIAVVVAYARLEFGDLKTQAFQRMIQLYGDRLVVEGDLEIEYAFPPRVGVDGVRLRNSEWGTRPDMLTVERMEAEVDLLPLVMGDMAVPRIRMIGVDIVVEQRADGKTNWDELNEFETAAGGPATPPAAPGGILPTVGNASVSIANGAVTVVNSVTGGATTVNLSPGVVDLVVSVLPCG